VIDPLSSEPHGTSAIVNAPQTDGRSPHPGSGDLVKVARAENEAEAEFLHGLLQGEGVPSLLRRTPSADVPEFLAAGARDVLVSAADADVARDIVIGGDVGLLRSDSRNPDSPLRVIAGLLIVAAFAAVVIWLAVQLGV
jgi:Putative prokaryotic signal transducing protein